MNQGRSITEQSDLDELLHVAQLAGVTFTAGTYIYIPELLIL